MSNNKLPSVLLKFMLVDSEESYYAQRSELFIYCLGIIYSNFHK